MIKEKKYISGTTEIVIFEQKTDTITYITTPEGLSAIVVASSNTAGREWYWVFADHLGSITTLVRNSDGQKFEMSYDACKVKLGFCECSETKTLVEPISYEARGREGNRRDPNTWENYNYNMPSFLTDRGYTGHVKQPFGLLISANQLRMLIPQRNDCGEHLEEFILINMNGRMYDPETARFLSPDVVIADPSNPASYNPYAYVLNNPLKYTDPSGYVVDPVSIAAYIIAGAILYSSNAKQNADPATGKWDWNFTNWFSEDKPGWVLGITINTSFTNTTFFASMNWSNGSNTTLGYNTQYGWGGGSAPQNMYFPNYNSGASEAAAVSSIARMDRSIYFQSTSNYMDFLISQSHNANSVAMEQGLTACEGCGGDAKRYRNLQLAYFLRNSPVIFGMPSLFSPLGIYPNPFKGAEAIYADFGAILTSWEGDVGNVFVLSGVDAGYFSSFNEQSAGMNSEVSVGGEIGRFDVSGIDPNEFRVADLQGPYSKFYASIGIPYTFDVVSVGAGVSWSKINETYKIFGTSVSMSAGLSVLGIFSVGYQRWGKFTLTN